MIGDPRSALNAAKRKWSYLAPAILTDVVAPSKLIGHDPIDGADRNGADHGHAHALSATATAGAKVARLSTTGTNRISAARRTFSQRGEATPGGQNSSLRSGPVLSGANFVNLKGPYQSPRQGPLSAGTHETIAALKQTWSSQRYCHPNHPLRLCLEDQHSPQTCSRN